MTIQEIRQKVLDINNFADDSERAHGMEDDLLIEVFEFIASGNCSNPKRYAEEALEVQKLSHEKWYS